MKEIYPKIYIGTEKDCIYAPPQDWAIIHACKYPCHAKALNYKKSLPQANPYYLIAEKGNNLFLNMVDMEQELLPLYTNPIMKSAILFIKKHIADKKILIHCNKGISRAPSIALIYLAHIGAIANDSFENAAKDFLKLYPVYKPGNGILKYLIRNWNTIIKQ